jgi:hypothetical protein
MNRLLFPFLLLLLLSGGCRCAADSEEPAGKVQLEVFSKTLTKDEMAFDYQITNGLRGAIYFICPDPACSDERWPPLPYFELNESSVLAVYSYDARKPHTEKSEPHEYMPMKLEPGSSYRGHVSLKAPYEVMRPYPTGEYKAEVIWSPMIDTFQLTIGYFTCPGVEVEPDRAAPSKAESARDDDVEERTEYIVCGTDDSVLVPQHLITAEAGVGHTGDWPDGPFMDAIRQFSGGADAGN